MSLIKERRGLVSPRVPQDRELARYRPELEHEIQEVMADIRHNEMLFDLEVEPDLIEQRIYERQALYCRYRFLIGEARRLGLHAIIRKL